MSDEMSFSIGGSTPQIPGVIAVQIALSRLVGEVVWRRGVTTQDVFEFDSYAESPIYMANVLRCAATVYGALSGVDRTNEELNLLISVVLKEMCVMRVPANKDGRFAARISLRQKLNSLHPWDRRKAERFLADAINDAARSEFTDLSCEGIG